ncbi:MAG: cyclase family protein [Actinomycetia bacterium]|nr:cyclase family protein [Actinomycetes bacterium]
MEIVDLSRPLGPATPGYPGDPATTVERVADAAAGDPYTVHRVAFSSHAGTHVDAPSHFLPGAPAVDRLPWEGLVGPARVVAVPEGRVTLAALETARGVPIILLKTLGPGADPRDGPAWTPEAVAWLLAAGVRGVGVDTLSLETDDPARRGWLAPYAVHRAVLGRGLVVMEGLDLARLSPGERGFLVCLPLRLAGLEAAPARAVWLRAAPGEEEAKTG